MAISCIYCGGTHATGLEARACWQQNQAGQAPHRDASSVTAPSPGEPAGAVAARSRVAAEPVLQRASAASAGGLGAAAQLLGRNVVVRPDAAAPAGWEECIRRQITAADLIDPGPAIAELHEYASARRPVVIELDADIGARLTTAEAITDAPHELGPRYQLLHSVLHHYVFANAVDATDPDAPRWAVLDQAVALGATLAGDGRGDIVAPDGTRVWIDGGPIRFSTSVDGVAVVHRVAIEHRSLRPFTGNDTAADLAADQLAAVTHPGGAARIIAPAGSGKTRVLTERARHIVRQWNIPAGAVCLIAFNKRAQQEMAERTGDLPGLQIRTLNAIALAIINGSRPFLSISRTVSTIDEGEVRRLIGRLVKFPRKRNSDPVATWIEALSLARLGLRSPRDVESWYDGDVDGFAEMFPQYRAELARAGTVDFDEQVQLAIELLLTNPAARAAAQKACRLLLVDEFQDLTPAHLLLVRLLAGPDGAVFGVGDDDQTIYGYNGADPAWLIDFADLFPGSGEHPLEVNYRCPEGIVTAASTLLRHNRKRVPKQIRAARAAQGTDGFVVEPSGNAVATTVDIITEALAAGTPAVDIAVLTRVNSLLAPVQVALGVAGVAVRGGVGHEFAERTAVRAALAWLRLATGADTYASADLAEALRRPSRPLHPNVSNWVAEQSSSEELRRLAARLTTEREAERVEAFTDDIDRLRRLASDRGTTAQILDALRNSMGLASSIASLDTHRRGMNRAAQNDDLMAIAQLADLQPDPAAFEAWLRTGLRRPWDPAGVTLSTVHRVKGQEWPLVVVHHADDDQFPHRLADDAEEERRVFHVAITRASREVHVVAHEEPSPFIDNCSTEPVAPTTRPGPGRPTVSVTKQGSAGPKAGHDLTPAQTAVFEALRAWRRHAAAGKPAYTVLSDAVLNAIAAEGPTTVAELARIKGIGPAKLDQYASSILAIVEQPA